MKRKVALGLLVLYFAGVAYNLVDALLAYHEERLVFGQPSSDVALAVLTSTIATASVGWIVLVLARSILRGPTRFRGWRPFAVSLVRGTGNFWLYGVGVTVLLSALLTVADAPDLLEALALLQARFAPYNVGTFIVLGLLSLPALGLWSLADRVERRLPHIA